ncbi:hypothetical protein GIB67_002584 [Kingdonia uniflora]|uniref:DOG1 domain-containing protein n=1 Tax=Kingdonia uniflora TaxID=39325 RepID=A0A7J7N477_9MAGN|nr:hypothetical protein GIB67_002584 [Kingdonia uniflora]
MTHYEDYSRVKSHAAKSDIFAMFNASWATSLERSLHWIAGSRPTTIFHLVYSESSHMFEARLMDLLHGRKTGDLGDLSPSQLGRVSELQCMTVKEENEITDELGAWQESAWDLVTVSADNEGNIERLRFLLERADDLRLRTMQKVMEVLSTKQGVEFLIATAELQFGVRGWGLDKDQSRLDGRD